jgi:hypothetical protein
LQPADNPTWGVHNIHSQLTLSPNGNKHSVTGMISITSNTTERTTSWIKSTYTPVLANVANTTSLLKPKAAEETVSISSQAIEKVQAAAQAPQNPYADRIIGFIRQQLQRDIADGANSEDLASRLAAGYQGFLQGFEEAYTQLGGTAALPQEVNDQLSATKKLVAEQVDQMAKEFGITSPVAQEDQGQQLDDALDQLIKATQTDTIVPDIGSSTHLLQGQSRSLNLRLTTAEGDIIELIAQNRSASAQKGSDSHHLSVSEQSSQWSLAINGDLNSQEQTAIADFLDQLGEVADNFYRGDLASAVEQAQGIGFDNQQISAFSISMQQVDIKRVESAYQGPQAGTSEVKNPQQSRWQVMGQWISQLEQVRMNGINGKLTQDWLHQLTEQSLQQLYPDQPTGNRFIQDHINGYEKYQVASA